MPKPSIIEDLTKFDAALREIAIIDVRIAEADVTRQDSILVAEGKFTAATSLLIGRRALLAEQLELYYRANRADLEKGKKKSIELQFGAAGIKVSTAVLGLLKSWKWGLVLAALTDTGAVDFIRTKETVNKEALKSANLTPEQLAEYGLKLRQPEKFWFTTYPAKEGN